MMGMPPCLMMGMPGRQITPRSCQGGEHLEALQLAYRLTRAELHRDKEHTSATVHRGEGMEGTSATVRGAWGRGAHVCQGTYRSWGWALA